ncbi:MAG: GTP-binding protein [Chloroflexi bacterium]|jgi:bifunctional enzyme CysN/CysC|nr:GTP-binding protein [Chloroflexota bacterium]MBT4073392.1 GTP-binding protein [Chloroflexota bacterium]MBT4514763.1 GTP-binding protein [Chloroflexota bacterium]MBT5320507.1 GTP-binding protein [Chloroflexota bacterium]MBT6681071.1 GTP-binding protein [Chloroflexota bacterium]
MELLRIATAGSVDDGKSTLIGRLLYDSKAIYDDVLESAEEVSKRQSGEYFNLALLTDGLRAEREQGITIDVAYRYFSTPKRKFILADTPGHVQYTRNMVTGASTADLALIIIDARNGVVEQSRRHAVIASLLGIRHMAVCVNKMDLVNYDYGTFASIRDEFQGLLDNLNVNDARFFPISALEGDNVVTDSDRMPWYSDGPLLSYLEDFDTDRDLKERPLRLPVQYVVRPLRQEFHDYRSYAGTIADGVVRVGQEVEILPSRKVSHIAAIETPDGEAQEASAQTAVSIRLTDDFDVSRGDMISAVVDSPRTTQTFDATVCWMSDSTELRQGTMLRIKHTTRTAKAMITGLDCEIDINTLSPVSGCASLGLNDIGRVSIRTSAPLVCDDYNYNRTTGSFILIDESTNETVAAGMIGSPAFGDFSIG